MITPLKHVFKQAFAFGRDTSTFEEFEYWWNVWKDDPEFIQCLETHLKEYYNLQEDKLKELCK